METAIEKKRRLGRESYYRHRDKILARNRARYAADSEYREKKKVLARICYQIPGNEPHRKGVRKLAYWRDADLNRKKSLEWYRQNRERCLKRNAIRREKNRHRARLVARAHSLLLTDRYIREQLSKYSQKSMWEWTPEEIARKRAFMVFNRGKKVTNEMATAMREEFSANLASTIFTIAKKYNTSPSNVHGIIKNKFHIDPKYKRTRRAHAYTSASRFLKMINAASALASR